MILVKSAIPSILVVLGACDRANGDPAPSPRVEPAPSSVAASAAPATLAKANAAPTRPAGKTLYVCPMHPEVVSDTPGVCPKCNMTLDPKPQVSEVRSAEDVAAPPNWP